jgi:MFS superfamily sulfate permease-like transporter
VEERPASPDAALRLAGEGAYEQESPFRPPAKEPLFTRTIPIAAELPRYQAPSAGRDLLAGVTVGALALPAAMAYAELAGLSPVNGLYVLLLPVVAYALLGSSRQLVIGPEGTVATLVAAAVLPLALAGSPDAAELAAMLALLVTACFGIARLLRLGWIADYFSRPVLIGYIHGVAVVLVIGQLGKLFGLSIDARNPLSELWEIVRELGSASGPTVAVAAVALGILLALRFLAPRLPGALFVVVGAIGVSSALDLQAHGVAVVGPIPSGLPSVDVPSPPFGDVVTSCRRLSASSSSPTQTGSSPPVSSRASTTRASGRDRNCSPSAPRISRQGSPRGSRSAPAAPGPRSTTPCERARRSPGSPAQVPSS